jgi:hypothetical protein
VAFWRASLVAGALILAAGPAGAELQRDAGAAPHNPQAALADPCSLPAALKWTYGAMSATRTETIIKLNAIPAGRIADFRAAYDRFNQAVDTAMGREIELLGRYFLQHQPACGSADTDAPGTILAIEEAKTDALRAYIEALSAILPSPQAEELVETDLQMIRAIEVRLRSLAYHANRTAPR